MDENPYKAPADAVRGKAFHLWRALALGGAIGCAVAIIAVVAAMIAVPFFVDMRENPRHWDEVHAREKAKQAAEKIGS